MCSKYHLPEIPPQLASLSPEDILCLRQITKHTLMEQGIVKPHALYEQTRTFVRGLTLEEARDTLAAHRGMLELPQHPARATEPVKRVGRPPLPRCSSCGQKVAKRVA